MVTQHIAEKFIHTCDNCSATVESAAKSRPAHWVTLTIARDAYDHHDQACADATISRLLCSICSKELADIINSWGEETTAPNQTAD